MIVRDLPYKIRQLFEGVKAPLCLTLQLNTKTFDQFLLFFPYLDRNNFETCMKYLVITILINLNLKQDSNHPLFLHQEVKNNAFFIQVKLS